ncbi:MAG: hypothetical protein JF564_08860, partial [Sphingomonas sp.]|nr:hypothetical protein [Sphingomonas sp.]
MINSDEETGSFSSSALIAELARGKVSALDHGRHLVVRVRPDAPVRMLFTGHMDTVYPVDHPFQEQTFLDPYTLNGPGVADMK